MSVLNPNIPIQFTPAENGKVVSFSGAGVSASFARPGEAARAKLDELTLEHAMRGIEVSNTACQGPVQIAGRRFGR